VVEESTLGKAEGIIFREVVLEEVLRRCEHKRILLGEIESGESRAGPRQRCPKQPRALLSDRGCSGEAGWGRAREARDRIFGNGQCSELSHSLGCVSSAVVLSFEGTVCTESLVR